MKVRLEVIAIAGGLIVTLLSGLSEGINYADMFVGIYPDPRSVYYGHPFAWLLRTTVASGNNPWQIVYGNLILDVLFWVIVVGVVAFIIMKRGQIFD